MRFFPFSSCLGRSLVEQTDIEKNQVMLFLNVYDLTPANNYLYWFGLGFYHSGIEVHGLEYAFGTDVEPTSGVFEVEPRSCPDYVFRRSILLGSTDMSRSEVCSFMDLISDQYRGNSYDLIYKNCNHFTNEICHCLTGKHIPGWVNRLARAVLLILCFLEMPHHSDLFQKTKYTQKMGAILVHHLQQTRVKRRI